MIETEAEARRLAEAIAADIALYNGERLRQGDPLDNEIEEGRQLFRTRVEAQHYAVYEKVIEDRLLRHRGGRDRPAEMPPGPIQPESSSNVLVSFLVFAVAGVAIWAAIKGC